MWSKTVSDPQHVCDKPMYKCLSDSCTLDSFLCRQCFSSRYPQHLYHTIIQISPDITDITENKQQVRQGELLKEQLQQEVSKILVPTHVFLLQERCYLSCVAVSDDGQIVACTNQEGKQIVVYFLNDPTNKRRYQDRHHSVSKIAISPNNQYLIGYGKGYGMILWNLNERYSNAKLLVKDTKAVHSISFSCDSNQVITSDKTIKVWDCRSGEIIQKISLPNIDYFTASTNFIYAFTNSAIRQFMKSNGKFVKTVYYPTKSVSLECANNELIIATYYKSFKVIHVRTGKLLRSIKWQGNSQGYLCPQKVGYSLQKLQFTTQMDKHRVTKFCMSSLKEIKSWETSKQIQNFHMQGDGSCVYIVNEDKILRFE